MADWWADQTTMTLVIIMMAAVIMMTFAIYASRYVRIPPDKVLVVYGRATAMNYTFTGADGIMQTGTRRMGYRIIRGGGLFVMPVFERIAWLSLETSTFELSVPGIKTRNGVPVTADLTAQVKIKGDEASLRAAFEQLSGKTGEQISEMARMLLQARARTTLSRMTLDEINSDRKAATLKVAEEVIEDYGRAGLGLVTLVIADMRAGNEVAGMTVGEDVKTGDLFKVIKNTRGELMLQRVAGSVEG